MISIPPEPIIIGTEVQMTETILSKPDVGQYGPTLQGFLTCMEMWEWVRLGGKMLVRPDRPEGPASGSLRVAGWFLDADRASLRSAKRGGSTPVIATTPLASVSVSGSPARHGESRVELFGGVYITFANGPSLGGAGVEARCAGRKYHRSDRGHRTVDMNSTGIIYSPTRYRTEGATPPPHPYSHGGG